MKYEYVVWLMGKRSAKRRKEEMVNYKRYRR
jgi:hypothetical protein